MKSVLEVAVRKLLFQTKPDMALRHLILFSLSLRLMKSRLEQVESVTADCSRQTMQYKYLGFISVSANSLYLMNYIDPRNKTFIFLCFAFLNPQVRKA